MRMRGFLGLMSVVATLPAMALAAGDSPAPRAASARAFGDVPDVALAPPAGQRGGWGRQGWQGTPGLQRPGDWAGDPRPGAIDRDRRGGNRLARAYDEGYDAGYDDGFDDGVDYAEDAVTYRGRWSRGPAGREGPGHGGSHGGPPPGYPGGVHVETWRSGRYIHAGPPGTRIYGTPGGGTVVVIQTAPAVMTKTVSYETVRIAHTAKKWAPRRRRPACRCTYVK